jgi:hypothetical protein
MFGQFPSRKQRNCTCCKLLFDQFIKSDTNNQGYQNREFKKTRFSYVKLTCRPVRVYLRNTNKYMTHILRCSLCTIIIVTFATKIYPKKIVIISFQCNINCSFSNCTLNPNLLFFTFTKERICKTNFHYFCFC